MRIQRITSPDHPFTDTTGALVVTEYEYSDGSIVIQKNHYPWIGDGDTMPIRETLNHASGITYTYSLGEGQAEPLEASKSNVLEMTGPKLTPVPEMDRDTGLTLAFAIICLLIAAVAPRILK